MYKYETIIEELTQIIQSQTEFAKLPSERELSEQYGVSRGTIRKALSELSEKGKILKNRGAGTFVSQVGLSESLQGGLTSLTEAMSRQNKVVTTKVISCELMRDSEVEKIFKMPTEFYLLKRVRYIDDVAAMYEMNYLPKRRFRHIDQHDLTQSLYKILKEHYFVHFTEGFEAFTAEIASKEIQIALESKKPLAVIKETRTTYEKNRLLEYSITYVKGSEFNYNVHLKQGDL